MNFKMLSGTWQPFCSCPNVLNWYHTHPTYFPVYQSICIHSCIHTCVIISTTVVLYRTVVSAVYWQWRCCILTPNHSYSSTQTLSDINCLIWNQITPHPNNQIKRCQMWCPFYSVFWCWMLPQWFPLCDNFLRKTQNRRYTIISRFRAVWFLLFPCDYFVKWFL